MDRHGADCIGHFRDWLTPNLTTSDDLCYFFVSWVYRALAKRYEPSMLVSAIGGLNKLSAGGSAGCLFRECRCKRYDSKLTIVIRQ